MDNTDKQTNTTIRPICVSTDLPELPPIDPRGPMEPVRKADGGVPGGGGG